MTVAAVWNIADIFNALMAFPNLIAILALSGVVVRETKDYFARQKSKANKQIRLHNKDCKYKKDLYSI